MGVSSGKFLHVESCYLESFVFCASAPMVVQWKYNCVFHVLIELLYTVLSTSCTTLYIFVHFMCCCKNDTILLKLYTDLKCGPI